MTDLRSTRLEWEGDSTTLGPAPWLDQRLDRASLWVTVQGWIDTNRQEIVGVMRVLIDRGVCTDEDVVSEATLLAHDVLFKCSKTGRLDLFRVSFFAGLKHLLQQHFRKDHPFLSIRLDDPRHGADGGGIEVRDTRPTPEDWFFVSQAERDEQVVLSRVLGEVWHPRSCRRVGSLDVSGLNPRQVRIAHGLYEAFSKMTRGQRKYWSARLKGQKVKMMPKAEDLVIDRTIKRILSRASSFAAAVVFGFGLWGGAAEAGGWKQTVELPYTHLDPSHTVTYVSDQATFVITDAQTNSAGSRKAQSGPGFFGQAVTASGINLDLAARVGAGQGYKVAAQPLSTVSLPPTSAQGSAPCNPSPVYFPFGKAEPYPQETQELQAQTTACLGVPLALTGHTCDIGTADYNLDLSRRRATVVANILRSRGHIIAEIVGRGETEPTTSPDLRKLNRRVDITPAPKDKP